MSHPSFTIAYHSNRSLSMEQHRCLSPLQWRSSVPLTLPASAASTSFTACNPLTSGGEFEFHVLIPAPCFRLGFDYDDMQRFWFLVPSTTSRKVIYFAHAPSRTLHKSEYICLPFMIRLKDNISPLSRFVMDYKKILSAHKSWSTS